MSINKVEQETAVLDKFKDFLIHHDNTFGLIFQPDPCGDVDKQSSG